MNFYEEFGLSPSASTEEIRQAHKHLARLLHPDNYQDEELIRLAECQMKRVNAIVSVLTEPVSRARYDRGLGARAQEPIPDAVATREDSSERWLSVSFHVTFNAMRRNIVWVLATLVCVTAMYWYLGSQGTLSARREAKAAEGVAAPAEQPAAEGRAARRAGSTTARLTRQAPSGTAGGPDQRVALPGPEPAPFHAAGPRPSLAEPVSSGTGKEQQAGADSVRSAPAAAASERVPDGRSTMGSGLTGTWVYLRPPLDAVATDLYPPEYIEVLIVEQDGLLRGRYRARYRVADRPISPDVNFYFEGKLTPAGRFPWTGNGAARGEVQLRLLSESRISVDWFTSQLGSGASLSSGTAVLVRRQDP